MPKKKDWIKFLKEHEIKDKGILITNDEDIKKMNRNGIIKFKCDCGENYEKKIRVILNRAGLFCKKCTTKFRIEKTKKTYAENPELQKKRMRNMKKTNLERYGVVNCFQSEEKKQKIKETCLKKYGVEFAAQSKEFRESYKKTCLEKYGVDNYVKTKEYQVKKTKTMLERYGVEHIFQSKEHYNKFKKTCLERYGEEYPSQNFEIKEKIKKTNLERYGFENSLIKYHLWNQNK